MSKRDHGKPAVSWWNSTPTVGPTGTATTWVGIRFSISVNGRIEGIRFWDGFGGVSSSNSSHALMLCWNTGLPQQVKFASKFQPTVDSSNGWNNLWIRPWFRIVPGQDYMLEVLYVGGGFFRTNSSLASPVTRNNITFKASHQTTSLDPPSATITENTNANAIDVLFLPD